MKLELTEREAETVHAALALLRDELERKALDAKNDRNFKLLSESAARADNLVLRVSYLRTQGDPFPPGVPPEQCTTRESQAWDNPDHEPNTWNGT